ncbi:MAG: DUF3035 domain-containing protein [Sphingomonadales bacterium]
MNPVKMKLRGTAPQFFVMVAGLSLVLSGCSSIGNALGVTKRPPDELQVVAKAPLSVPPDFNLQPPAEQELQLRELNPREMAYNALFPARQGGAMPAVPQDDVNIDDLLGVDDLDLSPDGGFSDEMERGKDGE